MTRIADVRVTDALRRAAALEAEDWEAAIEVLSEANRLGTQCRARDRARRAAPPGRVPCAWAPTIRSAALAGRHGTGGRRERSARDDGRRLERRRRARRDPRARQPARARRGRDGRRPHELADAIDRCWAVSSGAEDADGGSDPDAEASGDPSGPPATRRGSWVHGIRNWVRAAGGVLLCDSPEIQFEILDLYGELGLQDDRHRVPRQPAGALGQQVHVAAGPVPTRSAVGTRTGRSSAPGSVRSTSGCTLSDCGIDAPGLDIVAAPLRRRRARPADRGLLLRLGRGRRRGRRAAGTMRGSCGPSSRPATC